MNIIHLSTARDLRGGERQLLLLHRELLQRGLASTIMARRRSELARQAVPGISPDFGIPNLLGLTSQTRATSDAPTILHCHDANAFTWGVFAGAFLKRPVIVSRKVLFRIRPTLLNRWKYSRCAHVICVSAAVEAAVRRTIQHVPTSIIHDAPDLTAPLLDREDARRRLGLSAGDFVIGTVGYFSPEKNLPLLLHLAQEMDASHKGVRFAVVGEVDPKTKAALAATTSILAPGLIPNAVTHYRAFDAYVSMSRSEGLGSALLDAVVRDIPAVALDSGGGRDLFGSYMHRCVATPAEFVDKVKEVVRDYGKFTGEAADHGAWARSIFSVSNFVQRHVDVYHSIIERRLTHE